MVYSDTTNKNGAIQFCEFYCQLGDAGISGNATLLKQFTALLNVANSQTWHLIFNANGGWKYDDSNQTNLPQGTQNLTDGTATYALPTTALTVDRIEVKDSAGNYRKLLPITLEQIDGAVDEFYEGSGMPIAYRLIGSTIELFPAPADTHVTTDAGLKVYFERGASSFASTDTTKAFGFASEYHDIPPRKASIEWLKINKPDSGTLPNLIQDDLKRESHLQDYESNKFRDKGPAKLRVKYRSYE